MEIDLFILLLFLIPILTIGIPIILSIWIYRILKKKDINPKWKVLALIPILIVSYFVYHAFYPSSDFYKYDFKEVTGIELPSNSKFEYKTASYPDLQGDYTSVSIIKVETDFYKNLQTELIKNKLFENGERLRHTEMDNAKQNMNGLKIEREFSKQDANVFYYVAFLSDKKTILVQRSSN